MSRMLEVKLQLSDNQIAKKFRDMANSSMKTNAEHVKQLMALSKINAQANRLLQTYQKIGAVSFPSPGAAGKGAGAGAGGQKGAGGGQPTPGLNQAQGMPAGGGNKMPVPPKYKLPSGPFSGLQDALKQLNTFPNNKDAQIRARRAQMAADAADKFLQQPAWVPKAQKFLGNFQAIGGMFRGAAGGGGGMGIMANAGGVFGMFAEHGPLGLAIGAAVIAFAALTAGVFSSVSALREFRDSLLTGGGTGQQTAQMQTLLGSQGITNGAQMARAFAERLHSDPAAIAATGMANAPELYRTTNATQQLLAWEQRLHDMIKSGQMDRAMRAARVTGTEDLLKTAMLSDETRAQLKKDGDLVNQVYSNPEAQKNMAEFGVAFERMKQSFSTATVALFSKFAPFFTRVFNMIADGMNAAASFFDKFGTVVSSAVIAASPILSFLDTLSQFGERFKKMAANIIDSLVEMEKGHPFLKKIMDSIFGTDSMEKAQQNAQNNLRKAQEEATRATSDLAIELRNMRQVFGGGDRARGALPSMHRGPFLQQQGFDAQASWFGAFAL